MSVEGSIALAARAPRHAQAPLAQGGRDLGAARRMARRDDGQEAAMPDGEIGMRGRDRFLLAFMGAEAASQSGPCRRKTAARRVSSPGSAGSGAAAALRSPTVAAADSAQPRQAFRLHRVLRQTEIEIGQAAE